MSELGLDLVGAREPMQPEALAEFNRVHISGRDFRRAKEFVDEAGKHPEISLMHESLLLSAIVHYARPFSQNERGPKPSTNPKLVVDVEALLGADVDLHDRLISMRNKAVAHSEFVHYPVKPLTHDGMIGGPISVSRSWHVTQERVDLDAFGRIIYEMRRWCLFRQIDIRQPNQRIS